MGIFFCPCCNVIKKMPLQNCDLQKQQPRCRFCFLILNYVGRICSHFRLEVTSNDVVFCGFQQEILIYF